MQSRTIATIGGNDLSGGKNSIHPQQLARKNSGEEASSHRFVFVNEAVSGAPGKMSRTNGLESGLESNSQADIRELAELRPSLVARNLSRHP
jgi:hypothetical protein